MTDRQVGGEGLNVDLNAQVDRRVAGQGLIVDVMPPLVGERQADALGITVDYTWPQGVQFGGLDVKVDLVPTTTKQLGSIAMMVDYVASAVAANAARWSSTAFEMGTASPLSYWSGSQFLASGSKPVLWVTDHFEVAP